MSETPRPPLTTTTSIWPAAIVALVAVGLLATFLVINIVASPHVARPHGVAPIVVGGLALDPSPAPAAFYCRQPLEVPRDLNGAFLFPVRTEVRPGSRTPNLGAGDFDCYEHLLTRNVTSGQVLGFYRARLPAIGWSLFSTGAAPNGDAEYLFQKASNDGFYWEIGVTIDTVSGGDVRWTFTLLQNSETV